jgi:hypothetical protein
MADLASTQSVSMARSQEQPISTLRQDWIMSVLGLWFLGGLFLDGWAHNNLSSSLESFFTPWHAVFYTGFLAVAAYHGWLMWQNHQQGYAWRQALPRGYEISLLGLAIFAVGGVGDMLWHEILGIETGIDALFSPTHLLLATGIALVVSGPWRATSYRLPTRTADWRALFPLILSATFLLGLFTFMTQFAYLFTDAWVLIGHRPGFDLDIRQVAGVLAALLHSALIMGVVLSLVRRWHLPAGTLTFMMTVNVGLMAVMRDEFIGVPAAVLTGILGDVLLLRLQPSPQRPSQFHLFGALFPFILYTLYIVVIEITADSWWSVHMLAGLPVLTAIVGLLLSYLVLPPASLQQTAEN